MGGTHVDFAGLQTEQPPGTGQCLPSHGDMGQHGQFESSGVVGPRWRSFDAGSVFGVALAHREQHDLGASVESCAQMRGAFVFEGEQSAKARLKCVFKKKYATKLTEATSFAQTRDICESSPQHYPTVIGMMHQSGFACARPKPIQRWMAREFWRVMMFR